MSHFEQGFRGCVVLGWLSLPCVLELQMCGVAKWMRLSVVADLRRFGRHNADGKLAGSEHMCLRRVLLFWAYRVGSIVVECPLSELE
jgi:hypothetical protein